MFRGAVAAILEPAWPDQYCAAMIMAEVANEMRKSPVAFSFLMRQHVVIA
jgi:hypothetical protein